MNRSVGVGSEIQLLSEKNVYRSTALNLVRVEQLPASASAFRSWRNSFITTTFSIDATGESVILSWLSEAFNSESGEAVHHSGILPRIFVGRHQAFEIRVWNVVPKLHREVPDARKEPKG